jgi:hypothetical protein
MPANPASSNPYSRLTSMFANLAQQLGIEESAMGKNLMQPLTSAGIESFYGAADQQIAAYSEFEQAYKRALFDEFRSTRKMSAARRRQLRAAGKEGAGIDLSLIRNVQERKSLQRMLFDDVLRLRDLTRSEGLPGLYSPSTNPFTQTARMAVGMAPGEYQPFGDILQQSVFSIDPYAEGVESELSLKIGTRSLPSVRELQARMQRGGNVSLQHLDVNKKLFFLDIETTGVTDVDLARSISIGEGVVTEKAGVKTVRMTGDGLSDLGARFKTSQMAGYVAADPHNLSSVTQLGGAVIEKETNFGSSIIPKIEQGNIHDLTTEAGRTNAKAYFEDIFSRLSADDAHLVAYNGGFDVKGMIRTARSIDADETIIARFEERMANGGLVDVLGLTRERLQKRLADRLATAGSTPEQKAIAGLQALLSPEALTQARMAGEAIKPFGLENIVQSTNFLEILARNANTGDDQAKNLLDLLSTSQASHVDITDRMVAQRVLEYMDELDFRHGLDLSAYNLGEEELKLIDQARLNVASSRAIVPTTNLADPRYLTQTAYRRVTQEGIQKVELDVGIDYLVKNNLVSEADLQRTFGTEATSLRLKYDPNSGSFRFFGPSPGGGFETASIDYTRADKTATEFITEQIDRVRGIKIGEKLPLGLPTIQTLGMSPIQMSNIERVGRAVDISRASGGGSIRAFRDLYETKPDGSLGKITASGQDELIDALVATRQHIGFNYMEDFDGIGPTVSSGISRLMRGRHDVVKQDSMEAYARSLSKIDLVSASMDPRVRSVAVGISSLPEVAAATAQNVGFISKAVEKLVPSTVTDPEERAAQIAARSSLLRDQLENNARYLSEMGALTFETQKGVVAGSKITLASTDILKQAKTINEKGEKIGFLSDDALKMRQNKARLSIGSRASGETVVNMVYGGGFTEGKFGTFLDAKRTLTEAQSIYDSIQSSIDEAIESASDDAQALIEKGLATDRNQALNVLERFRYSRKTEEGKAAYKQFRLQYAERGVGVATAGEEQGSRAIASMVRALVGEEDTDTLAKQLGLEYQIGDVSETHVTAFPRASQESIEEAARLTGRTVDEVIQESSAPEAAERLAQVYRTAATDVDFFGRLRSRFSSLRVNFGFKGTDIFADRLARDQNIFAKMKEIKPNIYTGVAAVAALSAGYYIAKRKKQNDLYDEVMESQPAESVRGPMSIRDFNDMDQRMASFSSSRRDPLVTAGVVGNLDRNKVSHYKMGPNKYDHLYGR